MCRSASPCGLEATCASLLYKLCNKATHARLCWYGEECDAAVPLHACLYGHAFLTLPPHPSAVLQALSLLVKYVFVGEPPSSDSQPIPAQAGTKWLPPSPVATLPLPAGRLALPHQPSPIMAAPAFSPAVQAVSRKLYRLLRRTFAQWQPSSSTNLGPIVKLWLVVLCPWKAVSYTDTVSLRQAVDSLSAAQQPGSRGRPGSSAAAGAGSSSSSSVFGGSAGAVLRGAAGSAAGLVGSAGAGQGNGGQHKLFGGAGQVAASAAANLNRWGSEMAHHLSGAGQNGLDQGDGEQRDARDVKVGCRRHLPLMRESCRLTWRSCTRFSCNL
jgi:hypothetical protein